MKYLERKWRGLRDSELKLVREEFRALPEEIRNIIYATIYDPALEEMRDKIGISQSADSDAWDERMQHVLYAIRGVAKDKYSSDPKTDDASKRDTDLRQALADVHANIKMVMSPETEPKKHQKRITDLLKKVELDKNTAATTLVTQYQVEVTRKQTAATRANNAFRTDATDANKKKAADIANTELKTAEEMLAYAETKQAGDSLRRGMQNISDATSEFERRIQTDTAALITDVEDEITSNTPNKDAAGAAYTANDSPLNEANKIRWEEYLDYLQEILRLAKEHQKYMASQSENLEKQATAAEYLEKLQTNPNAAYADVQIELTSARSTRNTAMANLRTLNTPEHQEAYKKAQAELNVWEKLYRKAKEHYEKQLQKKYSGITLTVTEEIVAEINRDVSASQAFITAKKNHAEAEVALLQSSAASPPSHFQQREIDFAQRVVMAIDDLETRRSSLERAINSSFKKDERFLWSSIGNETGYKRTAAKEADDDFNQFLSTITDTDFITQDASDGKYDQQRLQEIADRHQAKLQSQLEKVSASQKIEDIITSIRTKVSQVNDELKEAVDKGSQLRKDLEKRVKHLNQNNGQPLDQPIPATETSPSAPQETPSTPAGEEKKSWYGKLWDKLGGAVGWLGWADNILSLFNLGKSAKEKVDKIEGKDSGSNKNTRRSRNPIFPARRKRPKRTLRTILHRYR